jgi:hypothetical protein
VALRTEIQGLETHPELAVFVHGRLDTACDNLALANDFAAVVVCADELPGEHNVWYGLGRAAGDVTGRQVTIYCSAQEFLKSDRSREAGHPPTAVWEQFDAPAGERARGPEAFSAKGTDCLLHHHLLVVQDLARNAVIPETIPANLIQAFEASWATGADGRLARAGLPGFSLTERRSLFSALFAPAGILLPDHWQIFESLWDGALTEQRDVLAVVRQLPRL